MLIERFKIRNLEKPYNLLKYCFFTDFWMVWDGLPDKFYQYLEQLL